MKTENKALTCGIISLILFFPIDLILSIISIVLGGNVLNSQPDNGNAKAAVIVGWVGIVWSILTVLILIGS